MGEYFVPSARYLRVEILVSGDKAVNMDGQSRWLKCTSPKAVLKVEGECVISTSSSSSKSETSR